MPELSLHSLLLFFLYSFSLLGISFGPHHLMSLSLPFVDFFLLSPTHLNFILFLIKLPSQIFKLLSVSPSFLLLDLQFFEYLIFDLLLLLSKLFHCLLSWVKLLYVSQISGLFLFDQFEFCLSLLLLDLQRFLHILECFLLLLVFYLHLSQLAIQQSLYHFLNLLFLSQILLVGLPFFLNFLIHLMFQYLFSLISFSLFLCLDLQQSTLLYFLFLDHLCFELGFINLGYLCLLLNHRLYALVSKPSVWPAPCWGIPAGFSVSRPWFLSFSWQAFPAESLCLLVNSFSFAILCPAGPQESKSKLRSMDFYFRLYRNLRMSLDKL